MSGEPLPEPEKSCEHCGAIEPEVGSRVQPVIILGRMLTVDGTFCRNCAAAFAESENWVIRGTRLTFSPVRQKTEEPG
jgi:hypothetical protein